jgi:hypothetical protein
MYLNGVICQKHCVDFEIKNEQIATPVISDYLSKYSKSYVLMLKEKSTSDFCKNNF